MANPQKLCNIKDLEQTGAFGADIFLEGQQQAILLVIDPSLSSPKAPFIRAYKNVCPHIQTPLETFPNDFLDQEDKNILICSTHGARFQVRDGACISGPCMGQSLTPIKIQIRGDGIYLDQV